MKLDSLEHECWHEVGHAMTCVLLGGSITKLEIAVDDSRPGRAVASCDRAPDVSRKDVACGGFAAEYIIFKDGLLIGADEDFNNAVTLNSELDKYAFYDLDFRRDRVIWTEIHHGEFTSYAIEHIVPLLRRHLPAMKKIVSALLAKKLLSGEDMHSALKKEYPIAHRVRMLKRKLKMSLTRR